VLTNEINARKAVGVLIIGHENTGRITCSRVTSFATNPTWIVLESNTTSAQDTGDQPPEP
jgi:hypothetical protein